MPGKMHIHHCMSTVSSNGPGTQVLGIYSGNKASLFATVMQSEKEYQYTSYLYY